VNVAVTSMYLTAQIRIIVAAAKVLLSLLTGHDKIRVDALSMRVSGHNAN